MLKEGRENHLNWDRLGVSSKEWRGKFLKKLWCCVGGSIAGNLVLTTGLKT